MEGAQALVECVPPIAIFGVEQTPALQANIAGMQAEFADSELRNVVVDDVSVRLVQDVDHCPQIARLRTEINLDAHRTLDPDFISREKKEIF